MFKKCTKCGEILFRDKFYSNKRVPSGLTGSCKECKNSKYSHTCEQCGKEFKSDKKSSKFCSRKCQGKWQTETRTGENHPSYKKVKCNCTYCNKEIEVSKYKFENNKNVFCDKECYNAWVKENSIEITSINCDCCGKKINRKLYRKDKSKNHFCSQECKAKWQERLVGENNPNYTKVKCNCDYCGKEISKTLSQYEEYKNHFCSKECHYNWKSENLVGKNNPHYDRVICKCLNCGKEMELQKSRINITKFCSSNCFYEYNKGENNYNYNPNKTQEEREQERKYSEYSDWRKEVYKRDNYTCQCCGKRGNGEINAHHIYGYAEYKDLRTDVDNGTVLCEECHKRYHSQYGYKNNNYKDFRTFLYNEMIKQNTLEARLFYINTMENIALRLEIRGLLELESA